MDGEILHERLVAVEGAQIALDERIDAIDAEEDAAPDAGSPDNDRFIAMEARLAECQERLARLETLERETLARTETLAAATAETAVLAEAALQEALAEPEPEPEPAVTEEIMEVEPESESAAVPEKPPSNWLERLIALR